VPLVPPLDLSAFDLTPTEPYFLKTFSPELDALDAPDAELLAIETITGALDPDSIEGYLNAPLDGLEAAFATEGGDPLAGVMNNLVGQAGTVTGALAGASAGSPPPGYNPITSTLTPPKISGGVTVNQAPPPTTPAPEPPTGSRVASLQFLNQATGNVGAFKVGDHWQLSIHAWAGGAVTVSGNKGSYGFTNTPYGVVPASGNFIVNGSMGAGDVGQWSERWFVDGVLAGVLAFNVTAK
jgi:hypothetical protein